MSAPNPEQSRYERIWADVSAYRAVAPGEHYADHFLALARPQPHHSVIDFGCGTGRGAARIAATGCSVIALDFAANCLDDAVRAKLNERFQFAVHDLTKPYPLLADYGYCTDVMEHVEPADVAAVLSNIVRSARRVYFNISTVPDIGFDSTPLHLTVQPAAWWREQLEALSCRIYSEHVTPNSVIFWCSAYATFEDFEHRTVLNVEDERIVSNIKRNLAAGTRHVAPHDAQTTEIMLLCGGPSLGDYIERIEADWRAGMPVVTVNGAYNWALDHGIRPGAQVIVDAREFNSRFTSPVVADCKYLICSQCDPALVASLPPDQTYLWHGAGDTVKSAIDEYAQEAGCNVEWYPVPGGTTVTLRALPLLAMLGFRRIHVYGFDSCVRISGSTQSHHAYEQPENDDIGIIPISVNGRDFHCQGWMVKQAEEFQQVMRHILIPAEVELAVYGDGLIASILNAAALSAKE